MEPETSYSSPHDTPVSKPDNSNSRHSRNKDDKDTKNNLLY